MAVTSVKLIASKEAENSQTTQYTATNVTAIIDKFTATNTSGAAVTISVNLVTSGDAAGNDNKIVDAKSIEPNKTYTFPELVGHVLQNGDFISTIASAATSLTIRASGRQIT